MTLYQRAQQVRTRLEFVDFVNELLTDLEENADVWENPTLERFLDALGRATREMGAVYPHEGLGDPDVPSWPIFAEVLAAAREYE